MTYTQAYARPDVAEGSLWIETPQTFNATTALHSLLDLARSADPGYQPFWVLTGPEGSGRSALVRRFASQAQRSSACDAVREAQERFEAEDRHPKIPSPGAFARRDTAWARFRAYEAMSPEERASRFGDCRHVCRPAEFLPAQAWEAALRRAGEALPVDVGAMTSDRRKDIVDVMRERKLIRSRYKADDPIRRTSMFFVDDAEHLKRVSKNKRGDLLAEMREFPKRFALEHAVTFVLVGTLELAEAVAECGDVRRIDLPAMALDGPEGTFGQVCRLIFGAQDAYDLGRLHAASKGAIGPLLTLARLQGLEPPFAIRDDELLRLPAPGGA